MVTIGVSRLSGSSGDIEVKCKCEDGTAVAGTDFAPLDATLEFKNGETFKCIEITLMPFEERQSKKFSVVLRDASPGVLFNSDIADGDEDNCVCEVMISGKGVVEGYPWMYDVIANLKETADTWSDQVAELLYCEGSAEDQAQAGVISWIMHLIALIWKLLFVAIPPRSLAGGWASFVGSLCGIALMTALAGDCASLLGCCIGIPDDLTAITLIALGTSLPDTLASRFAAQHDDRADNAIGNITGSNSVNVFLGIGISWSIGAIVWEIRGPTDEWREHEHDGKSFEELFLGSYPNGGFFVYTGTLNFGIGVYAVCAFVCLGILVGRRWAYGGELGGPARAQYRDASLLILLWVIFIVSVSAFSTTKS